MKHGKEHGAAAVEFALLVLPLIVIILLMIDFGTVFYDKSVITNASREAVRAGIIVRTGPSRLTDDQVKAVAQGICNNLLVSYGASSPATVTVTPLASRQNFGDQVSVSVSYRFTGFILGRVTQIVGDLGNFDLSSTTVMRNE